MKKLITLTAANAMLFGIATPIVDYHIPTKQVQAAKYSKINKELAQYLAENQQYEKDGNSDFANFNAIDSIKYKGGHDLYVNVNGDFLNLSSSQKTTLLNKIQGGANTTLLDHDKIDVDDYRNGSMITIQLGKNSIGHSKLSDYKTYKFYK